MVGQKLMSRARLWLNRVSTSTGLLPIRSEEEYVRMAYLVLLRREIDSAGQRAWRDVIASGHFHQQHVINTILESEEYLAKFGVDVISIQHRSRQEWIKTLPPFDRILDIGGSSPVLPEGALIQLGYPHRPSRIDILDRPPELQYWGKPNYDQSVSRRFDWGEVHYFHGDGEHVADVADLQERKFDCVFLGQTIEHIYPNSLPKMLAWIHSHLAPGGQLIFDTPNRLLTKIQCPHSLTDPDHKYEYSPAEMKQVMIRAGFEVVKAVGLIHLPIQASTGKYDPREFAGTQLLCDDADNSFLFAFQALAR